MYGHQPMYGRGAIQLLRNAMGGGGVSFPGKKVLRNTWMAPMQTFHRTYVTSLSWQ